MLLMMAGDAQDASSDPPHFRIDEHVVAMANYRPSVFGPGHLAVLSVNW